MVTMLNTLLTSTGIYMDADHAGDKLTRRSYTGTIFYINMAPVQYFSKRQNTVETSTFCAELINLKTAKELNDALHYKLRMRGVKILGPFRAMYDNQSVFVSGSSSESTLKKKHCSIVYHRVRESSATQKVHIYFEKKQDPILLIYSPKYSRQIKDTHSYKQFYHNK